MNYIFDGTLAKCRLLIATAICFACFVCFAEQAMGQTEKYLSQPDSGTRDRGSLNIGDAMPTVELVEA